MARIAMEQTNLDRRLKCTVDPTSVHVSQPLFVFLDLFPSLSPNLLTQVFRYPKIVTRHVFPIRLVRRFSLRVFR
jgi:hypothetical protein